jgi:hypothetical protein
MDSKLKPLTARRLQADSLAGPTAASEDRRLFLDHEDAAI